MILPSPTPVMVTGPDPTNLGGALVTAPLAQNPDELQFVGDLPLPIQATVAPGTTPVSLIVNPLSGNLADVQPGDVVAILDEGFEQVMVGTVSGNVISVSPTGLEKSGSSQVTGLALTSSLSNPHPNTPPIAIFRPSVVTRYSIQARSWDPSNPAITVPCLVRQQVSYPSGGALINWAGATAEVIAENIDGFTVDLSFDGGTTWLRQGSANWDAIVAKILAQTPGGRNYRFATRRTPSGSEPSLA